MCSSHNQELYHWGIKGMKWGVRRYQNKDGTLTPAGKKRYSDDVERTGKLLADATTDRKSAKKEYNKAYMLYNSVPTPNNYRKYKAAITTLQLSEKSYELARLNHKASKLESDGKLKMEGNKSKHRLTLEQKYRDMGYTDKQAVVKADERIRTEKIVAGTAALTVAGCAVYAARKRVRDKTDQIIKAGSLLQRVEMQDTNGQLHDMFYASTGAHDNKRYEGVLGLTRKMQSGEAYLMKLQNQGDIRVASKDKAVKVFEDLYKNDSAFRFAVREQVSKHPSGKNRVNIDKLNDRNIRKMYDNFNSSLIEIREKGSGADKVFYNKLKSAGYGAIQDVNDMRFSGYHAKNPLIVFDNSKSNIMVKSVTQLTDTKSLLKKGVVEAGKGAVEGMRETLLSPYGVAATTGTAAAMYVSDHIPANTKNKK